MKIIDPHIHLFNIELGDYHWLKQANPPFWPDKSVISRSFDETNLTGHSSLDITGFVHIEAGFDNKEPWRELAYLEEHNKLSFKAIAFVDIAKSQTEFIADITQLKTYPCLMGVRYILEDIDADFLYQEHVKQNLHTLAKQNLIFEAQFAMEHTQVVDSLIDILEQVPHSTIVINHHGFCPSDANRYDMWLNNIKRLSAFKNVYIKCSGQEMLNANNRDIDFVRFENIINACIEVFSRDRVMLASNFPLITLSLPYHEYWQMLHNLFASDKTLWQRLSYQNARHVYQIT